LKAAFSSSVRYFERNGTVREEVESDEKIKGKVMNGGIEGRLGWWMMDGWSGR
jgi:hypothetical protein